MKVIKSDPLTGYYARGENLGFFEALFVSSRDEFQGFNQRMFDEDFSRIFHYSNKRDGSLFSLRTNNDKLVLSLLGNVKTHHPSPIDKTIRKLVEEIAVSLLRFGKTFYFLHDGHAQKKTQIVSLYPKRIFRFAGLVVQFLPKRLEGNCGKRDNEFGHELRVLDKRKLLLFRTPNVISRMLSRQNSVLASVDKHYGPNLSLFPKVTHETPEPRSDFDVRVWRDISDHVMYRATRKTGWNGRKYDLTKRSDFFDCYRLIRFRRNQLIFRDQILAQLSDELTRVGRYYENGFYINVSPAEVLPTVAQLDELEARLSREEAGFTEVIDFCLKR